jgi:hypothetical protein
MEVGMTIKHEARGIRCNADGSVEAIPPFRDFDEYDAKGMRLIEVLGLKLKRNGRVDTSWGDKTPYGLALTVKRIVEEGL